MPRSKAAALPDLPFSGHRLIETLKPQKVKIRAFLTQRREETKTVHVQRRKNLTTEKEKAEELKEFLSFIRFLLFCGEKS
jgi:hypothetical protein